MLQAIFTISTVQITKAKTEEQSQSVAALGVKLE